MQQYHASQYILNRVFHNTTNTLRTAQNSSQDYMNAVFAPEKDALRVNIAGGMLPPVKNVSDLPATAEINQLCPVCPDNGTISFYKYTGTNWICQGGTADGIELSADQRIAVAWLSENLQAVKDCTNFEYVVKTEEVVLNGTAVEIQGETQNIDDDLDKDGDTDTPYRIDIKGYALGIETYATSQAVIPDRYYTKIVYEPNGSQTGVSHIFLDQEEYNFFAALDNNKNVIKIYYVANVFPSAVKITELQYQFPGSGESPVVLDSNGNYIDITDVGDTDNDDTTFYRLVVSGYALDMEAYFHQDDPIKSRCAVKMSYADGQTAIYLDKTSYNAITALNNGKNIVSIYTLGNIETEERTVIPIDNVLDTESQHSIQNRAVTAAINSLLAEIQSLKDRVAALENP